MRTSVPPDVWFGALAGARGRWDNRALPPAVPSRKLAPWPVRPSDYTPFPWTVEHLELTFVLHPTRTLVTATLRVTPAGAAPGPLVLDGLQLETL
ncbi:MAG: hypothetical protein ACU0BF_11990 [Paracoccaceae bacterium]